MHQKSGAFSLDMSIKFNTSCDKQLNLSVIRSQLHLKRNHLQFVSNKLFQLGNICLISLIFYLPFISNHFNWYGT